MYPGKCNAEFHYARKYSQPVTEVDFRQCDHCGEWHWLYSKEEEEGRIVVSTKGKNICRECYDEADFDQSQLAFRLR